MLPINSVYLGDCLEVMKQIDDKSIDMILCDLPYGTIEQNWDKPLDTRELFKQYRRIIKDLGCICLMISYPKAIDVLFENRDIFKYDAVWVKPNKTNFANAKNRPLRQHEIVYIFSKATTANGSDFKMNYNPQGLVKIDRPMVHNSNRKTPSYQGIRNNYQGNEYIQEFTNYPSTIITTNKKENGLHPTQKPVALFEYLIKTYTNKGDLVLDNCAGSGTTAIACLNTNRKYILMEKEPKYYEIILDRIKNHVIQGKMEVVTM